MSVLALPDDPGATGSPGGWWTRAARVVGLVVVALAVGASPAAADPAGPTNFRSEVEAVTPPVDGLAVEVLGGDAFLQVRNDGHEIVVPGYAEDEQYLRFDPDGTVWVNLRSAAHWQNSARYSIAESQVPDDAGPDQPPRWVQVSDDGTWAWHDHRIHWMSPNTLPGDVEPLVAERQVAYEWPVPMRVDGTPVEVTGTLTWLPPASPLPTLAAFVVALGLAALLVSSRSAAVAIGWLVAIGVVATGVVGVTTTLGLPPGVQGDPLSLILTGVALVVAVGGVAMRGRTAAATVVAGAAGIPLVVWAITQAAAITAPIVPPDVLPAAWVRIAVGVAAGTGLGAAVAGVRDLFVRPLAPTEPTA